MTRAAKRQHGAQLSDSTSLGQPAARLGRKPTTASAAAPDSNRECSASTSTAALPTLIFERVLSPSAATSTPTVFVAPSPATMTGCRTTPSLRPVAAAPQVQPVDVADGGTHRLAPLVHTESSSLSTVRPVTAVDGGCADRPNEPSTYDERRATLDDYTSAPRRPAKR